jgi:hypothetical protein
VASIHRAELSATDADSIFELWRKLTSQVKTNKAMKKNVATIVIGYDNESKNSHN